VATAATSADDSAGGKDGAAANGEGGGDDRPTQLRKKIVRRKSRFGKLPPLPSLGGGSSHAENGVGSDATTSDGEHAGENGVEHGGDGLTELGKCMNEEELRERKWMSACMQSLFEHSEEKGGRALETEDMSKLFERLKDEALRLQFAHAIEEEVKRSVKRSLPSPGVQSIQLTHAHAHASSHTHSQRKAS
jgi:hypothetical protein